MQQKTIWKHFLIFGFSGCFFSCGKTITEYVVKGEFYYINITNQVVKVRIVDGFDKALSNYSILPNDSLILTTSGDTHSKTSDPSGYKPGISGDTTTLIFKDSLCYSEYHFTGPILQNIDSYSYQKRGDRDYVFFFKIDTSLLNKTTRCQ
jgi:hypothetical protein